MNDCCADPRVPAAGSDQGSITPVRPARTSRSTWLALGLVLLVGGLATALLLSPARQPDLVLGQELVDLGPLRNGEVRSFDVALRNAGAGVLEIEAVTTSCGCTAAAVTTNRLRPGESGRLQVTFDSGAHGPDERGPVQRQVFVASNDPNHSEVVLTLRAEILAP